MRPRGGILIVDELFADVAPAGTSLSGDVERGNIVVLRSFGKFFGLAGLRLGFALAASSLANRLDRRSARGPLPVRRSWSGSTALADETWKRRTLASLAEAAERLDVLLARSGLENIGGTSLYRLTRSSGAHGLFNHLGRAGILVRHFAEDFDLAAMGTSSQRGRLAAIERRFGWQTLALQQEVSALPTVRGISRMLVPDSRQGKLRSYGDQPTTVDVGCAKCNYFHGGARKG